jgi:hypothetical protein
MMLNRGVFPFKIDFSSDPEKTLQTAFRYLVWSDAQAIKDKVDLAKRLGVRGVAIFKIDGGEDPGLWNVLPKVR